METQNIAQSPQTDDHFRGKGALDAFLNLLSLVTLGWTAFAFGGVVFQIINRYFSNSAFGYQEGYYSGMMKFHIASLLILTPVFIVFLGALHKQYKERKLNSNSGIHRWLTYLMLFIAFCNIVGSLIALVFKFLDGVFFSSFILKSLTIFIIALGIFGYYWYDLKRKEYESKSMVSMVAVIVVSVLALGAIVWGFVVTGSPIRSRMINFDNKRVQDLSNLQYQMNNYYTTYKKLPSDFNQPEFLRYRDPETQESYEYRILSETEYEVCVVFSLDAEALNKDRYSGDFYVGYESWNYHKQGRQCYKQTAVDTNLQFGKPIPTPVEVVPPVPVSS